MDGKLELTKQETTKDKNMISLKRPDKKEKKMEMESFCCDIPEYPTAFLSHIPTEVIDKVEMDQEITLKAKVVGISKRQGKEDDYNEITVEVLEMEPKKNFIEGTRKAMKDEDDTDAAIEEYNKNKKKKVEDESDESTDE